MTASEAKAPPSGSSRLLPALAFAHDVMMSGLAFTLAFLLRVGGETWSRFAEAFATGLPIYVGVSAAVFLVLRLYRGVWRYASLPDLLAIARAVSLVTLLFVPLVFLLTRLDAMPRSVPLIAWFVQLVLMGGPRLLYRVAKDGLGWLAAPRRPRDAMPVLLVGAGAGSDRFLRSQQSDPAFPYWAAGVLDSGQGQVGRELRGVRVMAPMQQLEEVLRQPAVQALAPQKLVVTDDRVVGAPLQDLLTAAERHGLSVLRLPGAGDLEHAPIGLNRSDGKGFLDNRDRDIATDRERSGEALADADTAPASRLRPIRPEDLLNRPQVQLDHAAVAQLIAGKRVMVTGAGGSIGGELCRQVLSYGPAALTLVDHSEHALYAIDLALQDMAGAIPRTACLCDITDRIGVAAIMDAARPEILFHAAALKHVPLVEANPARGVLTNTVGTAILLDAAQQAGVGAFVLISTDKAVAPVSVMGQSKRLAEWVCHLARPPLRAVAVRFGNVLGSSGSVVPLFEKQLAAGGPLTVTHPEMQRFFMTQGEAVALVLQASAHAMTHSADAPGEVLVLDMGQPVRILDLARQMIRLSGQEPERDIAITITGLRPGEKLQEALWEEGEAVERTTADGVLAVRGPAPDAAALRQILGDLETAARAGDAPRLRAVLAHASVSAPAAGA